MTVGTSSSSRQELLAWLQASSREAVKYAPTAPSYREARDLSGAAGLQKALKDTRFIACVDGKALYVNRNKALFFRSGSDQRCAK